MSDFSRSDPFREPASSHDRRKMRRLAVVAAGLCLAIVPAASVLLAGTGGTHTAEGYFFIETGDDRPDGVVELTRRDASAPSQAWIELLRSYQVLDSVVVQRRLHVRAADAHARAFDSFRLAPEFLPGAFVLDVDRAGRGFTLRTEDGALVEEGAVGSPIGRKIGFQWAPPAAAFEPGARIAFEVLTPRAASGELSERLTATLDSSGNFLQVRLTDPDPDRAVATLKAIMERYVHVVARLEARRYEETLVRLEEQLETVEERLFQAEAELIAFKSRADHDPAGSALSPAEWKAEEGRVRQRLRSVEHLYSNVRGRVEAARLPRATMTPDVRILDAAHLAEEPRRWSGPLGALRVLFLGLVATVAVGALFGRMDRHERTDFPAF